MAVVRPPSSSPHGETFADLGLPAPLLRELARTGLTAPFPIQVATIPDALAGRDVLSRAATGSGKTLAFLLPLVARLSASPAPRRARRPRALVLAPTRELAAQIERALAPLAKASGLVSTTIFGGVPVSRQATALAKGVDVVVACPGRLLDLVRGNQIDLSTVEITVIDEADHLADLGFLPDVRRILDRTPQGSQRMLFSATLDAAVDVLVTRYLTLPARHEVHSPRTTGEVIHRTVRVDSGSKLTTLVELTAEPGRVVVFTRTKRAARKLARQLTAHGVPALELHGDLTQNARQRNLKAFSDGSVLTLVATDIAARGIHVDDVAMVVHADPPSDPKTGVHRSGRTARAGASGTVVTLAHDDAPVATAARTTSQRGNAPGGSGRSGRPSGAPRTDGARAGSPRSSGRRGGSGQAGQRGGAPRDAASRDASTQRHSAASFSAARRGR